MIYITQDGTWGSAEDVMIVDVEAYEADSEFQRILEDMDNGNEATELWNYLHQSKPPFGVVCKGQSPCTDEID